MSNFRTIDRQTGFLHPQVIFGHMCVSVFVEAAERSADFEQ
jgi:hypothetical protein